MERLGDLELYVNLLLVETKPAHHLFQPNSLSKLKMAAVVRQNNKTKTAYPGFLFWGEMCL